MNGLILKISNFFHRPKFLKGYDKADLLIYDDIFPHPISGFRYEEFKVLLQQFKKAKIFLEPLSYPLVNTEIELHQNHVEEFNVFYSELKNKLIVNKKHFNINTKLFYCVFF